MGAIINAEQPADWRLDSFMAAVHRRLGPPAAARYDVDTWIMEFDHVEHDPVAKLASDLGEDCIAVLTPAGTGYLAGPQASAWGPFDLTKFKRI